MTPTMMMIPYIKVLRFWTALHLLVADTALQNASGKIKTKCECVQQCEWRRSSAEVTITRHDLVHVMSPMAPKGQRVFRVKQRGLRV